jgi:hypothetical protein
MPKTAHKKVETSAASAATTEVPANASSPSLIAFHVIQGPQGKPPILTPIGAAFAHPDGEGFTLDLSLMPTSGGRILLRAPQVKKPA